MHASWPGLLLGLAFLAGADEPKKPADPRNYSFLVPIPILQKLDLDEGQKKEVMQALADFAARSRDAQELRERLGKTQKALEKAKADGDREAGQKALQELAEIRKKAAKLRDEFEPRILAVLSAEQKKRYQELKKTGGGAGGPGPSGEPVVDKATLAKLRPLTEMGKEKYQGFEGGLYPGGKNERPEAHDKLGRALAKKVVPLDKNGKPSVEGKVVLLAVGMSNTSQEFTALQRLLSKDDQRNPHLVAVNGAQGGMTARLIMDPESESGKRYWRVVDERLAAAGVSRAQVQVVWIKEADAGPSSGFPAYARTLESELKRIVQELPARFPNLKLAYLSSRTYGGYARTRLNPEPYAFESGFSVKWLIENQIKGDEDLNPDPDHGKVRVPWLSWGPYLWAAGSTKRSDGFSYEESDFAGDGTHPSEAGQRKVAELMLKFFKTDPTARPWFVKGKE